MDCGLLYSGGKDSTLAALLLEPFYDVTLLTATFGVTDDHEHARRAAEAVGFPFEIVELDRGIAEAAVERMRDDGYPRDGIQQVHEAALERVADPGSGDDEARGAVGPFDAVADGTRRDDRVPTVSRATARSVEDRHGVDYLAPLSGFGRGAVDRLVDAHLEVTEGPSEEIPRADYEAELRTLLRREHGDGTVEAIFPAHDQTYVECLRE